MKELSEKELRRRKLIPLVVMDYFGGTKNANPQIVKALIKRDLSILDEWDIADAHQIQENLEDKVYIESISNFTVGKSHDFDVA